MTSSAKSPLESARKWLSLADESMRKKDYEQALQNVRKVQETDPNNMYARAYEERIRTAMAETEAMKSKERQLLTRIREFVASQEKPKEKSPKREDPAKENEAVVKEIDDSILTARERLHEVILARTADPTTAVAHAKETITALTAELKTRLDKIGFLKDLQHKQALEDLQEEQHEKTRKLYRSLVYMMQKLGVGYQHRESLLQLVGFYAKFSPSEEAELKHSALLGIYEDLLRGVYAQEGTSDENLVMLEKTRQDFGISDSEHEILLAQVKNQFLAPEKNPTLAVIDASRQIGEFVASCVRSEFPKVDVTIWESPEDFEAATGGGLPNIVLSGLFFGGDATRSLEFMRELKKHPAVQSQESDFILMLPTTDPFFREVVEEMGFGKILQKPFSKELLMWTLRPLLFKASGAPVLPS